jgi:hypothetical protein
MEMSLVIADLDWLYMIGKNSSEESKKTLNVSTLKIVSQIHIIEKEMYRMF